MYKISSPLKNIINKPYMDKFYYFDNNSTTLIQNKEVIKGISNWLNCGNASNILHDLGKQAHSQLVKCRTEISTHIQCKSTELYFTSGATESNNIIIQGVINNSLAKLNKNDKISIISTSFEHPSVINIFKQYENNHKIEILYVGPELDITSSSYGTITSSNIEHTILNAKYPVKLMSIMHGNNETGAMQKLKEIGILAKKYNIFFHSDTTQTFGKFKINPHEYNIDSFSFSAHKFHGPKGIGGMYLNENSIFKCKNLSFGGEQEKQLRPGTENIALITGMTIALLKTHQNRKRKNQYMLKLKNKIINELGNNIKVIGASIDNTLPNTILALFPNIDDNKKLAEDLNKKKIYISIGSACQTGHNSHVLNAYNLKVIDKIKIIRISLSEHNTENDVNYLIKTIKELI